MDDNKKLKYKNKWTMKDLRKGQKYFVLLIKFYGHMYQCTTVQEIE